MAEKSKLDAALDELITGKSPEEIVGAGGVLKQLTKAVVDPIFWTEDRPFLDRGAALNNKESQCLKLERIIRPV
jgi:hypothetical protein